MNDILFGNNNRPIITKLSKRSFHKNRTRNMTAILAIALTAFLFTSVIALAFGVQSSMTLSLQMEKGSKADGEISYMTEEQFKELINSDFIEQAGCRKYVGYTTNTVGHAIEINYADSIQQELTFCTPTHGTAPQAANEIATTDIALKALGVDAEIGAIVPIEFQLRGQTYHFEMVVSGWWEATNSSVSLMIVSQNFMDDNRAIFPNTYSSDKEIAGTYLSAVVLKNKVNVQEQLKEFAYSVGGSPDDMSASNFIQCTENGTGKAFMQPTTMAAVIGFLMLFVICGYLLIYNIFDISVMQEVRQYGLLRTIGTTTRQIKRIVNRQAMILTLIGLPVGLVAGFGVSYLLLPVVVKQVVNGNVAATQFSASPFIFVAAAMFTIFTVFISTRKPVKKASKISPLEAIRYTEQNNSGKKEVKRRNGAKLSRMAFSNLGRNKRRSAFIMLSMLLCIVLFNSVIVITQSLDEEKGVSRTTKTDFTVYNSACANRMTGFLHHSDALADPVIELIHQQGNVTNERYLYRNSVDDTRVTVDYGFEEITASDISDDDGRTFASYDNGARVWISPDEDNRFYGNVFGASEHFFDDLAIYEGETNIEVLKQMLSTGDYVLLGGYTDRLTGAPKTNQPFYEQLQVGGTISFYKDGELYKTCTIAAKASLVNTEIETDLSINAVARIGGDAPLLYLEQNVFGQLYEQPTLLNYGFDVSSEKLQVNSFLDELTENNTSVSYTSTDLIVQQLQTSCNIVFWVGSMIAVIFALAGLINFTNMMITNIVTRSHEFATMQSIGMTHKQLRRMMIWEGVYYALGAGVIGCGLATLFGLTILRLALNSPSMWYFTLNFTLIPGVIVSALYLVMAIVVPIVALQFFNKGTVVERLRVSE